MIIFRVLLILSFYFIYHPTDCCLVCIFCRVVLFEYYVVI